MDAQLKKDWVEALRSGEYRQGREALYDKPSGSYCCLGVLCKAAGRNIEYQSGYTWVHTVLPRGIDVFTDMNDREDKTFNEIADYIETNL